MQMMNSPIKNRKVFFCRLFFMDVRKQILQGVSIDLSVFDMLQFDPKDVVLDFIVLDVIV